MKLKKNTNTTRIRALICSTHEKIADLNAWLILPLNTGAVVVAFSSGIFDFQFLYKYFLSDQVLRMQKVKAPLLRGNKIMFAFI